MAITVGLIDALFIFGMANIVYHLLRYPQEEKAIAGLANNVESLKSDLVEGLRSYSIVAKRYWTLKSSQKSKEKSTTALYLECLPL